MDRKPKNPKRSVAQLRTMLKRRRFGAWFHAGLAVPGGLAVAARWYFDAGWFWWVVSFTCVVSALIGVLADINAYYDTKKRIAALEKEMDTHGLAAEPVRDTETRL